MANLAIKGHNTRGKEVIQLLEMLGGENIYKIDATRNYYVYFVLDDKNKTICALELNQVLPKSFVIYTLEEFEEKYPYKVGDDVITKSNNVYKINDIMWDNKEIVYSLTDGNSITCWYNTAELRPYKEENYCQVIGNNTSSNGVNTSSSSINEEPEPEPKAPILSNRYDYAEGKCGYVIPDGYEFDSIKEGFQTEIILKPKKLTYPKDYEECCEVLGILDNRGFGFINLSECENVLISRFIQLKRCRDAYWKIAGEQLGLNKPWEPDWENDDETKFCIYTTQNMISIDIFGVDNRILAFPTEEMRDAFYENFKELIEQCKELL